jgi:hypothetical protein
VGLGSRSGSSDWGSSSLFKPFRDWGSARCRKEAGAQVPHNHAQSRAAEGGPSARDMRLWDLWLNTLHALCQPVNATTSNPLMRLPTLQVSGEALQGKQGFGLDPEVLSAVAAEVAAAHRYGVRIAIVVGGGNYFRCGLTPCWLAVLYGC